ncbi:I78 family peptidase inhibitor [Streptomyces sp. H10-C2]|uniref:I78 family peptidase inhibitor n=1 Tax=unclassified Streptomyces TaxID=2593676 RepID=UPI0024BBA837|nr:MULTISPECIES: I78 family peptidase inhibitor [unclassified Streptomyces]MDJ0343149.1 I78 family peptidase inhibitor [Streptomyces sp. PH10-H1]MDJ0371091.1 I78 family peptidase inhibitor [Streptomyces sp. H10-C2]
MAPIPTPGSRPQDDPEQTYVGLTTDEAERRARERGWSTVRSLPAGAIITMEYVAGRLNFSVADGRVTRCWQG